MLMGTSSPFILFLSIYVESRTTCNSFTITRVTIGLGIVKNKNSDDTLIQEGNYYFSYFCPSNYKSNDMLTTGIHKNCLKFLAYNKWISPALLQYNITLSILIYIVNYICNFLLVKLIWSLLIKKVVYSRYLLRQ